jgi:hypothetical protein
MNALEKPAPRLKWPLILGVVGFAAGFFGPLVFVPEANQGPLVGIFISGPLGVVIGFVLFGLCSMLRVAPATQWKLLYGLAAAGVIAVLITVQPGPVLIGRLYDTEVRSCSSPDEVAARALQYWQERITSVTWHPPTEGWRERMRGDLRAAPGVVVDFDVRREVRIYENRKPWNRGSRFVRVASPGSADRTMYLENGACRDYPPGLAADRYEADDNDGPIKPPPEWPPTSLDDVLLTSPLTEVPADIRALADAR